MTASLNDKDFESRFQISGTLAVLSVLRDFVQSRAMVTVFLGRGPDFFLTQILSAGEGGVTFDVGANATFNRWLESVPSCLCMASHQGITVRFTIATPMRIQLNGLDAYRSPLPVSLLRLQRRETHRVVLSISKPLPLKVVAPESAVRTGPRKVETYPLHNLCVEGTAFIVPSETLFRVGDRLAIACSPAGIQAIQCAATVRHVTRMGDHGARNYQVGLRFENLNGRGQVVMQRFVTSIQLQQRALVAQ